MNKETTLRKALAANGAYSVLTGVLTAAFAAQVGVFMGVSPAILAVVGTGVAAFGVTLIWLTRQRPIRLSMARAVVAADAGWVLGAGVLIVGFNNLLTDEGALLLAGVSSIVGLFAVIQSWGIATVNGPKKIETIAEVKAAPRFVWEALTDLPAYSEWNPFILHGSGTVERGERLRLRMSLPGGPKMTLKPRVTRTSDHADLEWLGHLMFRGLFDGRHRFELVPTEYGTRVVHSEEFTGLLVPFLGGVFDRKTELGFEAMNAAMKERAENMATRRP